ncbi:hypothetical protein CANCADRAFT_74210 [Tortispora caseinolytica NRRL Y-17796]|uniref:Reticulon-like protein n=1 Tax=Tortispora caseinolytica NRRL Y-17796 TaxID=767744 RepID=A0A1E4TIQ6_9ASCO|nr:hypothetical protein CANCADRAFT_74210 [Tortispora caseinolytica NRRL Y-17796]
MSSDGSEEPVIVSAPEMSSDSYVETPAAATTAPSAPVAPATDIPVDKQPTASKYSVKQVLLWKNPVVTGGILAFIIIGMVISTKLDMPRLLVRLTAFYLCGVAAVEFGSAKAKGQSKGFVTSFKPAKPVVKASCIESRAEKIASKANCAVSGLYSIVYAENPAVTALLGFSVLLLMGLLRTFSLLTIFRMTILLAFAVPPLYVKYEKQVHHYFSKAQTVAEEKANYAWTTLQSKIAKSKKA